MGTFELFDRLAGGYDDVLPTFAELGRQLIDWLDPVPGTRVLDIGAGRGAISAAAAARGCRVTAVDAAPAMVARLAREHPDVRASVMDAHRLAFGDASFELVTAGFVMHVVDRPAVVAAEVRRVLTAGGILTAGGTFAVAVPGGPQDEAGCDFYPRVLAEFERYTGLPVFRPLPQVTRDTLVRAGFTAVEQHRAEVRMRLPDPQAYWRWMLSHGAAGFVASLPPQQRDRMRQRVAEEVAAMPEPVLHRSAVFLRGRARSGGSRMGTAVHVGPCGRASRRGASD